MSRYPRSSGPRPSRSRAQWRGLVAEQEASGLSVPDFCREHDLATATMYSWRSRLAREEPAPEVTFVQLEPSDAGVEAASGDLSVTFPSGATLRCPADHLAELVAALVREAW